MSAMQNFDYPRTLDALLIRERPIVAIVDMQGPFLEDLSPEDVSRMIDNQIKVVRRCKEYGLPVALIEYDEDGSTISPLIEEVQSLLYYQPFIKFHDDGFSDDYFRRWMGGAKGQPLLLMGVHAGACLLTTAASAYFRGHKPITAECLIGDQQGLPRLSKAKEWFNRCGTYLV